MRECVQYLEEQLSGAKNRSSALEGQLQKAELKASDARGDRLEMEKKQNFY